MEQVATILGVALDLPTIVNQAIGAIAGTLAGAIGGGMLVWQLERRETKNRENREKNQQAFRRKQDIWQKKSETLLQYLPRIYVELYPDDTDGRFYRSYFHECYNLLNASRHILESPEAQARMTELLEFYDKHKDTMYQQMTFADQKALDLRKTIAEAFSRGIFMLFSEEVAVLTKKLDKVEPA